MVLETELMMAQLGMLRLSLVGVVREGKITNKHNILTLQVRVTVKRLGDKVRESRLRCFGLIHGRHTQYIRNRLLKT